MALPALLDLAGGVDGANIEAPAGLEDSVARRIAAEGGATATRRDACDAPAARRHRRARRRRARDARRRLRAGRIPRRHGVGARRRPGRHRLRAERLGHGRLKAGPHGTTIRPRGGRPAGVEARPALRGVAVRRPPRHHRRHVPGRPRRQGALHARHRRPRRALPHRRRDGRARRRTDDRANTAWCCSATSDARSRTSRGSGSMTRGRRGQTTAPASAVGALGAMAAGKPSPGAPFAHCTRARLQLVDARRGVRTGARRRHP